MLSQLWSGPASQPAILQLEIPSSSSTLLLFCFITPKNRIIQLEPFLGEALLAKRAQGGQDPAQVWVGDGLVKGEDGLVEGGDGQVEGGDDLVEGEDDQV